MMNVGKLAGIRASASGDKPRLKRVLSVDMISAPLNDFRHTTHVSHAGDVFGDASFLDGETKRGEANFFSRAILRKHVQREKQGLGRRDRGGSHDLSMIGDSPAIKNAISLQELQTTPTTDLHSSSSSFSTLPHPSHIVEFRLSDSDSFSDSLTSFTIDLGPSLVTEVLALIDSSGDPTLMRQDDDKQEEI